MFISEVISVLFQSWLTNDKSGTKKAYSTDISHSVFLNSANSQSNDKAWKGDGKSHLKF